MDTTKQRKRDGALRRGQIGRAATAVAVATALGLTGLLTLALYTRVGVDKAVVQREPIPVPVARFSMQESYSRELSFLGLVRAGRTSKVGFEVPGTVAQLPVREGTEVDAGDVLARLDTAQLKARRAAVAADLARIEAELELARIKSRRQRDLQATGAVSQEAFDETRLRAQALTAQLDSVRAQLGGIDIDLRKSVLRAPYPGAVAERLVNSGAVVTPGTPVVRLMATGKREAHIGIAAEQAGLLTAGETYPLILRNARLEARLRSMRPDVDPTTLTATAVFELPGNIGALDGEPVNLLLQERVAVRGGWVPLSALLEGNRGLWTVLRLKRRDGATVALREAVEVLEVQDDRAYVRGTLPDSAEFIADGVHRVAPGTPVHPQET